MLSKEVPIPKKFFLDVDWRTKKSAGEQKVGKIWKKYLANVNTILDFGGGSRLTGAMLKNLKWNGIYEIVDSSINVKPEYVKLDDVNKKFDMVVCLQVIEHLYFEDFLDLLPQLSFKLKPGGTLVIGSDHPANSGHLCNYFYLKDRNQTILRQRFHSNPNYIRKAQLQLLLFLAVLSILA